MGPLTCCISRIRASRLLRSGEGGQSWRRAHKRPRLGIFRPRSQCWTAPLVLFIRRDNPSWLNSSRPRTLRMILPAFRAAMFFFLSIAEHYPPARPGLRRGHNHEANCLHFPAAPTQARPATIGATNSRGDANRIQRDSRVTNELCTAAQSFVNAINGVIFTQHKRSHTMIFPLKQVLITTVKSPASPSAKFLFRNAGELSPLPRGTLKAANLEGLPPPRPPTPMVAAPLLFSLRCKIKGCVFPASDPATGMCHSHGRQEIEPEFFQSYQPILYVLQQAKFDISNQPSDDERGERRLRVLRHKTAMKGAA